MSAPASRPSFQSSAPSQRPAPSGYSPYYRGTTPGMASRPSPAFRPGIAPRYGAQPPNRFAQNGAGAQNQRRSPYRPDYHRRDRGGVIYEYPYAQPYYVPYGLGYYGDDWSFGDDGYADPGSSADGSYYGPDYGSGDGSGYYGPDQYNGFDPQAQQPGQAYGQPYGQGSAQPGQFDPNAPRSPYYGAPHRSAGQTGEPVVTLVFKDHRPNQKIQNYMLIGDTLTVWDNSPHDISLDQLDIAATERLNHEAGIDLFLPATPR